jgi:hypothetical protein
LEAGVNGLNIQEEEVEGEEQELGAEGQVNNPCDCN